MGTNKIHIRYIQYHNTNVMARESKMTMMDEMDELKDKSTLCTMIVVVFADEVRSEMNV